MGLHASQQGESAVFQLHHHAFERFLCFFVGNLKQLQDHRLVFSQHFAGGDTEQQGIANLACCACDGNANGGVTHDNLRYKLKQKYKNSKASNARHVSYRRYDNV